MDVVITYVNGLDPVWRQEYEQFAGKSIIDKHFRDWGTLKFLFRGIEKFMPFIDNIHLVVSGPSQVPDWVSDKLHVVYHKDIIPENLLPVFNAAAIEMFLHRIPGLDEKFIYFNDDFFPVAPSVPEDFFVGDKIKAYCKRHWFTGNVYKNHCLNSDRLARKTAGISHKRSFIRPQHVCSPMWKSQNEHLYSKVENDILSSITRVRSSDNCNQYLYTDYLYFTGRTIQQKLSKKHMSLGTSSPGKISAFLSKPDCKFVCINDVQMTDKKFKVFRDKINESFELLLPERSKYEK